MKSNRDASTGFAAVDAVGLAAAVNQAAQGVLITDSKARILYVNPAFEKLTGYSAAEVLGRKPNLLKSGRQDGAFYRGLWESIQSGRPWHGDLINRRKDGSLYTEEMTVAPVVDANGAVVRYIAFKQDVTERRQREEVSRFVGAIVASSDDAIYGNSLDGIISSWNLGAEGLYGYSAEEMIGKPITSLAPPEYHDEVDEILESVRRGLKLSRFETVRLARGGRRIEVCLTVSPIRDASGKIVGAGAIARDISDRRRAEKAMRDSAAQFRALFERSLDCIYVHDFEGKFLEANPSAWRLLGYDRSELGSLNFTSLLSPEELDKARRTASELRETGTQREPTDFRLKCKSGAYLDVETMGAVIPYGTGRAILGIARNITERRKAQDALRESEERFRIMADHCPTLIWVSDAQGGSQFVNRAYLDFFQTTYEKLEARNWQPFVHPEDAPQYVGSFMRAVRERARYQAEARVRRGDGAWRWIASYAEPRFSASGDFLGHVGLSMDITDRKQAEDALRRSEEKFRQLAENIREVFWMRNTEPNEILYVSPGFEHVWGRSPEELYRNPLAWAMAIEPEDRDSVLSLFERQTRGEPTLAEYRIRTPRGEVKWIRDRAFPVRDAEGRVIRVAGLAEDITLYKEAEAALRDAKEKAEAANRAKSEFLANMSHEIRTPMNGVIGMTGLLLDTELSEEQREYAEIVRSSAESLLAVINDILDFSKVEAGKLEMEVVDFDIRRTVEDAIQLLGAEAERKGLTLESETGAGIPWRVRGDPGRLRQVLLNLVGNAVKFTAQGGVKVRARLDREEERSVMVRISVEDTGIGIPADRQADIFSPFTQVDGSTTRRFGGTGLGLAIARQLVGLMGGEIGVRSEEGKGATFWFTAVFGKAPEPAGAGPERVGGAAKGAQIGRNLAPLARTGRILVAEDDTTNQKVILAILSKFGCRADAVANGHEALASLRRIPYDLVLLDCQMPEMNGCDTAVMIRNPRSGVVNPDIPIIAVTALAMTGDREKCLMAGMSDYLAKPVEPAALAAMLDKWLPARAGEAPADGAVRMREVPSQVAVFDEKSLFDRVLGDRALAQLLVAGFLEDIPRQLAALEARLLAGDVAGAERQAHSIRGAAANVSGLGVQRVAQAIEEAGRVGDLRGMAVQFAELEDQYRAVKAAMSGLQTGGKRT